MLLRPAALALATFLMTSTAVSAQERVDPDRLNALTRELASDRFEGRAPGTPAETLTVEWIADQFKAMGLEPGGPDGSWFQTAEVSRTSPDGPAVLTARAGNHTVTFERADEIIVGSDRPVSRISLKDTPVVFAGYGVSAPERGWDDFKDVDVRGKIILVIVNDPDFGAPEGHPVAVSYTH